MKAQEKVRGAKESSREGHPGGFYPQGEEPQELLQSAKTELPLGQHLWSDKKTLQTPPQQLKAGGLKL